MTAEAGDGRRSNAQSLIALGSACLHGLRRENIPGLGAISALAEHLPDSSSDAALEQAAAEHYRVFGMNVFPYAGAFLDDSRLLGGHPAEEALVFYAQAGFVPATSAEGPDHLGHELMFAAQLVLDEADDLLGRFLQYHLLAWILPLHLAVRRQDSPFYTALTAAGVQQAARCLAKFAPRRPEPDYRFSAPPPDLLQNPETRLKDIAALLLTPVHSGIFLSRENIGDLGRLSRVPRGFGDRVQLLGNLLRAAAEYETLDGVIDLLKDQVSGWIGDYAAWEAHPQLGPGARFWKARAGSTLQLLEDMQAAVR